MGSRNDRFLAANPLRGYASGWRDFIAWCVENVRPALPADLETACLYFVDRGERLTNASLGRRIAAISRTHQDAGFESPTARSARAGGSQPPGSATGRLLF